MSSKRRPRHSHSHQGSSRSEASLATTQASLEDFRIRETSWDPQSFPLPPDPYGAGTTAGRSTRHPRTQPEREYYQPSFALSEHPSSLSGYSPTPAFQSSFSPVDSFPYSDTAGLPPADPTMSSYAYSPELAPQASFRHAGAYSSPSASQHLSSSSKSLAGHSRRMSESPGHMLPQSTLPSLTSGGFRETERELSARRRRRLAPRREKKLRARQARTASSPNNLGSSGADSLTPYIDISIAHHSGTPAYHNTSRSSYAESSSSVHGGAFSEHIPSSSFTSYPGSYTTASSYGMYGTSFNTSSGLTYSPLRHDRSVSHERPITTGADDPLLLDPPREKPQCWGKEHGCNGREFSTFSNLLRHQREKSGTSTKATCHRCGAEFTRKTARDGHVSMGKCKGPSR